jgi:hypothetical protein
LGALALTDDLPSLISPAIAGVQTWLLNGLAGLGRRLGYQAHIMPEKSAA